MPTYSVHVVPTVLTLWLSVFGLVYLIISTSWLLGAFQHTEDTGELIADVKLAIKRISRSSTSRTASVSLPASSPSN